MRTFTQLTNLFTNLSNNTSTANTSLGGVLINDQHRYLIQKYFDNERTVTTSTVGAMNLTLTGAPIAGATSATLTAVWAYPTCTQLINFSDSEQRSALFTYNSATITWSVGLNQAVTTAITTVGVSAYNIPANISKIINDTVTIGQLKFTPAPVASRVEWDRLTTLPYASDIPNYYFIWNGTLNIFPVPSTTGNVITFNFKSRVADLSFTDYTTGTIGMTAGGITVTGSGTNWSSVGLYPTNTDLTYFNLNIQANPPYGDGIWYPISTFSSDTVLTLAKPVVNAPNIASAGTYVIGQIPILSEDFHDMLVYGALMVYFTSIVSDQNKFKMYEMLYNQKLDLLKAYAGTKSVNVDLGAEPMMVNPNLFLYKNS